MNKDLWVTVDMLNDIHNFAGFDRKSNAEAATFGYSNGFNCNVKFKDSLIEIIIYK